MMEEKCLSTAVLYVALESVLLTEDITAGTVVMSLCLFVVMTLSILIPEASASGIVLRCAMLAGCFIAAGVSTSATGLDPGLVAGCAVCVL